MPMTDGGTDPDSTNSPADDAVAPPAVTKPVIPFGEWPSPISAADVARAGLRLSFPTVVGADVWWQEARPDEGGRSTVICHDADGRQTSCCRRRGTPGPGCTSTAACPTCPCRGRPGPDGQVPPGRAIVFASYADQRLYLADRDTAEGQGQPAPLTPEPTKVPAATGSGTLAPCALRYADFALSPDEREIWCVREQHDDGKVSRAIVAVPLDGSAAERARRDPHAGHRGRLLRVPQPVAGRPPAGLDLLEPPAHAVGRHRAAGRRPRGRRARPEPPAQGQPARVRAGPAVARQRQPVRGHRLDRLVEHLPARPVRRAAARAVPGRRGVRRAAVAARRRGRSPGSATAGWP